MAWVALEKDNREVVSDHLKRGDDFWMSYAGRNPLCFEEDVWNRQQIVELPKGSIEKLIGHKLTWEDEPVELKEN